MIEFVSYDGNYPNACSGTLVIKIDGVQHSLKHVMHSGGRAYFTNDYQDSHVEQGPWSVDYLPKELEHLEKQIAEVVNENVRWGCCGGCL